jgi:hypothetical protein
MYAIYVLNEIYTIHNIKYIYKNNIIIKLILTKKVL